MEELFAKSNQFTEKATSLLISYLPKVFLALIVLFVGFWLCRLVTKLIKKALNAKKVDPAVGSFLSSVISILLKVVVIISAAQMIGIATTSFVAVLGAMGLAVGLALQGSLSNFAGGVLILILKPFRVGDFIESAGSTGTVQNIHIFQTTLLTPDNKRIIIPNGTLSNGTIINYSAEETRRVDLSFGISYDDDTQKAEDILKSIATNSSLSLKDPAPFVALSEYADSSINFVVRVWTKTSDYWPLYWEITKKVKKEFDANNISIPYPQMDIHMEKN